MNEIFDHEKLHVYRLELDFVAWATSLRREIKAQDNPFVREVCDQLDRASLSMLLNTAEENGKRQQRSRAKFFDDARGSGTECAACLDALVAKEVATQDRITHGKRMLLRIVSMLSRLVDRFSQTRYTREDAETYEVEPATDKVVEDEHEDDDEDD